MTWIDDVTKAFGDGVRQIRENELCTALKTTDQNFVKSYFKSVSYYDSSEENAYVPLSVLMIKFRIFLSQSPLLKIKYILEILDQGGTGLLDEDTFKRSLLIWMASQGTPYCDEDVAGETSHMIFSAITGQSEDNVITIQELLDYLVTNQGQLEEVNSRFRGGELPMRRAPSLASRLTPSCSTRYFTVAYVLHNQRKIYSVLIIILLSLLGFLYNAWCYNDSGQVVAVARGCGMALNVTCGLILIFMLRHSATHLRSCRISKYLPLDHLVLLHKTVAWLIGLFATIHTVAHLINVLTKCKGCDPPEMLTVCFIGKKDKENKRSAAIAFVTGWLMLILFIVMAVTSYGYIRQRHHKVFKLSHLLFVPFLIILPFHGLNAWKWLLLPVLLFVFEKIISSRIVKRHRYGDTYIQRANILPNGVVHLVIERPKKFKFQPGDYIFMQIPELHSHEWHPFTISSAPENTETISLHVRTLGDWTQQLLDYFKRNQNRRPSVCESFSPKKGRALLRPSARVDYDDNKNEHETSCVSPFDMSMIRTSEAENSERTTDARAYTPVDMSSKAGSSTDRVRPSTSAISIQSLSRRVVFRTPKLESRIPEIVIETPTRVERSIALKKLTGKSPKEKSTSQTALDIGDPEVETKMMPHSKQRNRRVKLVNMSSTQTTVDLEDGCVNVVSTTDDDNVGLQVYVDGPYGTCTRRIFEADHAVMIAGGIGVTPFASVLQSIMYRAEHIPLNCPKCSHKWTLNRPRSTMNLKKVHFIWINRDRRNFEWFASLLTDIDAAGQNKMGFDQFLDMELYLTSEPDRQYLQDLALQLALNRASNRDSSELLSKLNEKTRYGRPDWDLIFNRIAHQRTGKVKVFYCGPPKVTKVLKEKCQKYHFLFRRELF